MGCVQNPGRHSYLQQLTPISLVRLNQGDLERDPLFDSINMN